MYYPMRVVRERQYKLIWNLAHPSVPVRSLGRARQEQWKQGPDAHWVLFLVSNIFSGRCTNFTTCRPNREPQPADDPAHARTLADLT